MANQDVRIGDAEREQAAARLSTHVGAGRLELGEFEERVDAIYRARTAGELAVTLADLPEQRPVPQQPMAPRRPHSRIMAAAWAHWAATAVICLVIWTATSLAAGRPLYFWPMWVIGPWGGMLAMGAVTGAAVCGSHRRPAIDRPV